MRFCAGKQDQQTYIPAMATEVITSNLDERVVLNVGGARYEVLQSTLTRYPHTLLGTLFNVDNPNRMQPDKKGIVRVRVFLVIFNIHNSTGEYFFDRNPQIFDMILNFYRTGTYFAFIYSVATFFLFFLTFN